MCFTNKSSILTNNSCVSCHMQNRGGKRKSNVNVGFTKEQAEAAMALYWKNNLAKFLLNVVNDFPVPVGMDMRLLYVALLLPFFFFHM